MITKLNLKRDFVSLNPGGVRLPRRHLFHLDAGWDVCVCYTAVL